MLTQLRDMNRNRRMQLSSICGQQTHAGFFSVKIPCMKTVSAAKRPHFAITAPIALFGPIVSKELIPIAPYGPEIITMNVSLNEFGTLFDIQTAGDISVAADPGDHDPGTADERRCSDGFLIQ